MGSSPIDFVNDYRLEVSRSLLQYTDTSVADIAFNCGFTSQSYFTKLFSRTFHMTPTEFRNSTKKIPFFFRVSRFFIENSFANNLLYRKVMI